MKGLIGWPIKLSWRPLDAGVYPLKTQSTAAKVDVTDRPPLDPAPNLGAGHVAPPLLSINFAATIITTEVCQMWPVWFQ